MADFKNESLLDGELPQNIGSGARAESSQVVDARPARQEVVSGMEDIPDLISRKINPRFAARLKNRISRM